jgi:inhibitor of the pro-sigma K processing machinery
VDIRTGLALVLGAALLYVAARAFWLPVRWLIRLAVNVALGGLALYAWNHWGHLPHLTVGINAVTAGTVGLLGIPGFVLVLAVKFLLATA